MTNKQVASILVDSWDLPAHQVKIEIIKQDVEKVLNEAEERGVEKDKELQAISNIRYSKILERLQ